MSAASTRPLQPEVLGRPQWLTGGTFGPEASIFAVLVDAVAVVLMWCWIRSAQARPMMLTPAVQAIPSARE